MVTRRQAKLIAKQIDEEAFNKLEESNSRQQTNDDQQREELDHKEINQNYENEITNINQKSNNSSHKRAKYSDGKFIDPRFTHKSFIRYPNLIKNTYIVDEMENTKNEQQDGDYNSSNQLQIATVQPPIRKTIKDIIDNNRTGIPAKSEIERKRKNKLAKERNKTESLKSLKSINSNLASNLNALSIIPKSPISNPPTQTPAVATKRIIFINGKAQIDPASLLIEQSQILNETNDPKNFTIINEDSNSYNSKAIYNKHSHTKKWTQKETEFFYECLKTCGTDFSMIEARFEGKRTRSQIKNKFMKEERCNASKINQVLLMGSDGGRERDS